MNIITASRQLRAWMMLTLAVAASLFGAGCAASAAVVIPTERPTLTPTATVTATATRDLDAIPTATPTSLRAVPTGGPSPTPLFGGARPADAAALVASPTRAANANPNAPRIEYFRTNVSAVSPGGSLALFWSTRNVSSAAIYQLDAAGQPSLVYNVGPDGNQTITISARLRGEARFRLAIGEGVNRVEETLTVPVTCPVAWFFQPAPLDCPNEAPNETVLTEQLFERGRVVYAADTGRIYALFNDGREPRWASYEDRYDPAIHPERDDAFDRALAGTGFVQAVGRLGFLWRGNDTLRTRLGNATQPEVTFTGFVQTARATEGGDNLFLSAGGGAILQLLPGGASWQIITPG